jgi:hypothetical protein
MLKFLVVFALFCITIAECQRRQQEDNPIAGLFRKIHLGFEQAATDITSDITDTVETGGKQFFSRGKMAINKITNLGRKDSSNIEQYY